MAEQESSESVANVKALRKSRYARYRSALRIFLPYLLTSTAGKSFWRTYQQFFAPHLPPVPADQLEERLRYRFPDELWKRFVANYSASRCSRKKLLERLRSV